MGAALDALVDEALRTGALAALPDKHLIGGKQFPSARGGRMETFDPGRGESFATFAAGTAEDVDAAVRAARAALKGPWRRMPPAERGRILARAAALLRAQADRFAVVEALDAGKRISEAQGDVAGAARAFEYYAGACDKLQGDSLPLARDYLGYTVWEPAGVAALIVPWNYPISTTARCLAPALAAGCSAVVKPAEQTPLTALMLAELLLEAGLPEGACNVVTGTGRDAGAPLVAHPGVDHVTFTGSVATGIGVMQAAAPNVTRVLLELGGKSPVVVLADCDMDKAVEGVLGAIYENAGQICSAGSRLVIDRGIHQAFVERLVGRVRAMTVGHGLRDADVGPVNSKRQLERVAGFVDGAKERGRRVAVGGARAVDPETGKGWFFQPTILDDVPADDPVVQEEIFGPVLTVQVFGSIEEAAALANGTPYGLVAGIYSRDLSKEHALARDIDAGQVYINEYFAGGIEVPFGGTKRSGFGREKGLEGLRSYCRVKSVVARI
ncbi:MAG: aldehyde dehydrogenase family protein [Alphaproteobacteria bacterium]|nr:aldehyde dehydrogenase family protein [Alphaproteobacteria bacterium]